MHIHNKAKQTKVDNYNTGTIIIEIIPVYTIFRKKDNHMHEYNTVDKGKLLCKFYIK